ncbi:MAG: leucine-rich repeat domain-containing protein, partial [Paramuribaculum sp.]|nr:leucine-rich repeat domain-containing protein [Paramuribaculum sp.]
MKKVLLLLIVVLAGAAAATARDFTYTYEGQTLTYTVLDEAAKTCSVGRNYSTKGDLIIPESASDGSNEYAVTIISERAFYNCTGLTSVTIPNSVTTIGGDAFYGCSGLTSVTIPESVTHIGGHAFYGCSGLTKAEFASIEALCSIKFENWGSGLLYFARHLYINGEEITDLVIPESVTAIGNYTFNGCSYLTSITIGNSVTTLGVEAFKECSSVTSVVMGASVETISSSSAFDRCTPTTLTILTDRLESWSYLPRTNLQEVVIGDNVTIIPESAFSGCSGLSALTIPESITAIGNNAFKDCTGVTSLTILTDKLESWSNLPKSSNLQEVTIGESVTSIGSSAFYGCSGLTSVTIPNSVTTIGNSAFTGCSGLTSVTIPNSVTSI